jgi:CDP-glucose 4,6-dehydratase
MHVLITGHTGFKGSWLTVLLTQLGHEVSGIALQPVTGGSFEVADVKELLKNHIICDIRDKDGVAKAIARVNPDAVIHMAAQPLVIDGYKDPAGTMEINVAGTLNVLEACREAPDVRAVLIVTTDKVYKDKGSGNYSETDELGGFDPYSASKAMADLLAQSYANLELNFKIGIARAGNVIGLGDVSANRLIPDIASAFLKKDALTVRHLGAVRPWQHVLDCVHGYVLALVDMVENPSRQSGALVLNFGPEPDGYKTVEEVIDEARLVLGGLNVTSTEPLVKETHFLTLDSSKARALLDWRDKLDFPSAIRWSLEDLQHGLNRDLMDSQVSRYLAL